MKPIAFQYERPTTVEEAVAILAERGEDAAILAGGQSLVPALSLRMAQPAVVVDVNRIQQLSTIEASGGGLAIGALTRQRDALGSPDVAAACPLLGEALGQVGHPETRNRGTVVGSLAHADPAAELPAVALALDAEIELRSAAGTRAVPAEAFFVNWFTTAREANELATAVRFPAWPAGRGYAFEELCRRHHEFALVGVAATIDLRPDGTIGEGRIALAGVGATPIRSRAAEAALAGREPSQEAFAAAGRSAALDLDPASDVHGSAAFRRHIATVLVRRALTRASERASTEGGTA